MKAITTLNELRRVVLGMDDTFTALRSLFGIIPSVGLVTLIGELKWYSRTKIPKLIETLPIMTGWYRFIRI